MNELLAERGAILESYFKDIADYFENNNAVIGDDGYSLRDIAPPNNDLEGYKLIDTPKTIKNIDESDSVKCLAIEAPDGSIIVHFRGTGDGYWGYNDAAYGLEPSRVQTESTEYLESIIKRYRNSDKKIYVTGHSQGGNTAQYATLAVDPEYGDYITQTISLDGPGFSEDVVKQLKDQYSHKDAQYYEKQRQKIYSCNGYRDYVSPLGQIQVVPEDHVFMVQTYNVDAKTGEDVSFGMKEHVANCMIHRSEDGSLHLGPIKHYSDADNGESNFRKLVIAFNQGVLCLKKDEQSFAATIMMRILEHALGDGKDNIAGTDISVEDWARFAPIMSTVLLRTFRENPELIAAVLLEEGLNLVPVIDNFLKDHLPGYEVFRDKLDAVMEQRNIYSFQELLDYIAQDPIPNLLDILIPLISDPEVLGALLSMGAALAVAVKLAMVLMPLIIKVAALAAGIIKALAAIVAALAALKIVVDFLVEMGPKILAKIKEGIDYMTELAHNIYERIQQTITTVVDAAVDTAIGIYKEMKNGYERFTESVSVFAGYVRGVIAQGQHLFTSIACSISRALTGCPQPVVSINVTLLSDTVDSMQRLANRVQTMDRRLDSLYSWLARDNIEQSEGVWTSLVNLYNLMRADISVDEGGRIRRMANNLSGLFTGYEDAEKWVLQQL